MTVHSKRLVYTNLLDIPHGNIRYMLDNSVSQREVSENIEIIGWAISRKSKIQKVLLTSGKTILATAKLEIFRPLVAQHYKHFYNSETAGFKLVTAALPGGKFYLKGVLKNGRSVNLAEFELVKFEHPRLLFMHIAKAAGSTVNSFFASHYLEEQYAVHIESNQKWRSSPDDLKRLHFLSGHIHLYALEKKLNLGDYYKVTVVREPYAQLCSHLSWIRKLTDPGEEQRFKVHAVYIQKFAKKLETVDFTDPTALINLLGSLEDLEMRLVDNCHVRYFTPVPAAKAVNDVHARKAIKASKMFDMIGTTDRIDAFFKDVAIKMSWPEPEELVRENVTQNFYGLDLSNNETRAILKPLVQHDIALYEHIKSSRDC